MKTMFNSMKNDEFMATAFFKKLSPSCPELKEVKAYSLEGRNKDSNLSVVAMSEVEGMKCYTWTYTENEVEFETFAKKIKRDADNFRKTISGKAEIKGITEDQAVQRTYFENGDSVVVSEMSVKATRVAFELVRDTGSESNALKKLQETDLSKAILTQT